MRDLVGRRCRIEFNLPALDWPIPGFPAWADCKGWEPSGMILLGVTWYNVSIIKSISPYMIDGRACAPLD